MSKAFTLKGKEILSAIKTEIRISSIVRDLKRPINKDKKWIGVWDTGASKSSISQRVVDELGLISVGNIVISTSNGVVTVNAYYVDFTLPNDETVKYILVSCADLGDETDVLIGMDIISLGDFSITNANNQTTFSFRMPPESEIDYTKHNN